MKKSLPGILIFTLIIVSLADFFLFGRTFLKSTYDGIVEFNLVFSIIETLLIVGIIRILKLNALSPKVRNIAGLLFCFVLAMIKHYVFKDFFDYEMKYNSIKTIGIVKSSEYRKGRSINIEFNINGETRLDNQSVANDKKYTSGDSVVICYSKLNDKLVQMAE